VRGVRDRCNCSSAFHHRAAFGKLPIAERALGHGRHPGGAAGALSHVLQHAAHHVEIPDPAEVTADGMSDVAEAVIGRVYGKWQNFTKTSGGNVGPMHALDVAVVHAGEIFKYVVEVPLEKRPRCHRGHNVTESRGRTYSCDRVASPDP
jgi:hypothetical protein